MQPEILHQIALTLVPHIGPVQAKILLSHLEPAEIFAAKRSTLEKIDGIGRVRASSIKAFEKFSEAEAELAFIEKYSITPLFITDPAYPQRLLNCYDSPTLLYYKGTADLNAAKIVAVVGSRSHTEYGRQLTQTLIEELAAEPVLVISGLAYGIDAIAHKAAVKNGLATVGVMGNGLDKIYPAEHTTLARDMLKEGGGLLTEFRSQTQPDKHNFPARNRIVAGMSDATVVVETGSKGGSMITAELANGYNKDVFAFPGRVNDTKSEGCNGLIRHNKAILLTDARQLLQTMGWEASKPRTRKIQKELFIELTPEQKQILTLLKEKEAVHIDEINIRSGLSNSAIASAILTLELQQVILSLPGKMYQLA